MKKIFTFLLSLYKDEYVVLNKLKKKKCIKNTSKKLLFTNDQIQKFKEAVRNTLKKRSLWV